MNYFLQLFDILLPNVKVYSGCLIPITIFFIKYNRIIRYIIELFDILPNYSIYYRIVRYIIEIFNKLSRFSVEFLNYSIYDRDVQYYYREVQRIIEVFDILSRCPILIDMFDVLSKCSIYYRNAQSNSHIPPKKKILCR